MGVQDHDRHMGGVDWSDKMMGGNARLTTCGERAHL